MTTKIKRNDKLLEASLQAVLADMPMSDQARAAYAAADGCWRRL